MIDRGNRYGSGPYGGGRRGNYNQKRGRGRSTYLKGDPIQIDKNEESPFKSVLEWKQDKVTALFFKLGDSVSCCVILFLNSLYYYWLLFEKVESNALALQIIKNWDLVIQEFAEEYTASAETFLKGFALCVTQVPFKIPHYALLTGLLNVKNHDLGGDLLSTAAKCLNQALEVSEFTKVKLLVRYLELSNDINNNRFGILDAA